MHGMMKQWNPIASAVDWLLFLLMFSTHNHTDGREEDRRVSLAAWRLLRERQGYLPPVFEHAAWKNWNHKVYGSVVEASTVLTNVKCFRSIRYSTWFGVLEITPLLCLAPYDASSDDDGVNPCAFERRQHLT